MINYLKHLIAETIESHYSYLLEQELAGFEWKVNVFYDTVEDEYIIYLILDFGQVDEVEFHARSVKALYHKVKDYFNV